MRLTWSRRTSPRNDGSAAREQHARHVLCVRDDDRRRGSRACRPARLLRRRRAAEHRGEPCEANGVTRARAGLRVGRLRRTAGTPAAFDRRSDDRDASDVRDQHARAVRLLPPGRADRRRLSWRGADRPVRQHQLDGHRRLLQAQDAPSRIRWRLRDRDQCAPGVRDHAAVTAQLRRAHRLPYVPGNLGGAEAAARIRREQGWLGSGPSVVVTDLGIYHFDDDGEMRLDSLHPGTSIDAVRESIGWSVRVASDVAATPPPTPRSFGSSARNWIQRAPTRVDPVPLAVAESGAEVPMATLRRDECRVPGTTSNRDDAPMTVEAASRRARPLLARLQPGIVELLWPHGGTRNGPRPTTQKSASGESRIPVPGRPSAAATSAFEADHRRPSVEAGRELDSRNSTANAVDRPRFREAAALNRHSMRRELDLGANERLGARRRPSSERQRSRGLR